MACDRSPGEGEGRGWRPIKMGRPDRAAPERQRSFREGTEAAQVPAERSGAACPTGAVTAGDWG